MLLNLLLLVVVPLVVSLTANLLTERVKAFGTRVSERRRHKSDEQSRYDVDLVAALASDSTYATHYLLVSWVGIIGLMLLAAMSVLCSLVISSIEANESAVFPLVVLSAVTMFVAQRALRRVLKIYDAYLASVNAPAVLVATLVHGYTRPRRASKRRQRHALRAAGDLTPESDVAVPPST